MYLIYLFISDFSPIFLKIYSRRERYFSFWIYSVKVFDLKNSNLTNGITSELLRESRVIVLFQIFRFFRFV